VGHVSLFLTLDTPPVSDILMNIQQTCTYTIIYIGALPYPKSETKLGSNLLVLKLNNTVVEFIQIQLS